MHIEGGRDVGIDRVEKAPEVDAPMSPVTRAEDRPGLHVEGGEERAGAVACVVVRASLDLPGAHRQHGLRAIEPRAPPRSPPSPPSVSPVPSPCPPHSRGPGVDSAYHTHFRLRTLDHGAQSVRGDGDRSAASVGASDGTSGVRPPFSIASAGTGRSNQSLPLSAYQSQIPSPFMSRTMSSPSSQAPLPLVSWKVIGMGSGGMQNAPSSRSQSTTCPLNKLPS